MGTLFVDKLDPQSGTSLEIGSSGDTITIPSGATIANSGTATGFGVAGTESFFVSKSSSDLISSMYKNTFGVNVITLRCGNIYGGGDLNWDRLIPGVIKALLKAVVKHVIILAFAMNNIVYNHNIIFSSI